MADTTQPAGDNARPSIKLYVERPAALVVDANRLASMLGCSVRTVRTWDAGGKLPAPLRIGGRVVWRVGEIKSWIDAGAPQRDEWERRRGLSPA